MGFISDRLAALLTIPTPQDRTNENVRGRHWQAQQRCDHNHTSCRELCCESRGRVHLHQARANRHNHLTTDKPQPSGKHELARNRCFRIDFSSAQHIQDCGEGAHSIGNIIRTMTEGECCRCEDRTTDLEHCSNHQSLLHRQCAGTHGYAEGVRDVISPNVEGHKQAKSNRHGQHEH